MHTYRVWYTDTSCIIVDAESELKAKLIAFDKLPKEKPLVKIDSVEQLDK